MNDHVIKNREAWTKMSFDFAEPGRRAWASPEITWGCWDVREADIHAFGDIEKLRGADVIELGCGTGYVSSWLARLGAKPVGIDITPAQLANARLYQQEFGIEFPLIEGNAEELPFPDASFDYAVSEYGASIWCDPYRWIPEAARVLRPGGTLVFLRNATISVLCTPDTGPMTPTLIRDWFSLNRIEWSDDGSVGFQLPTGAMLRLLRENGFEVEDLIELEPPADAEPVRYEHLSLDYARRWPTEEIWRARKKA